MRVLKDWLRFLLLWDDDTDAYRMHYRLGYRIGSAVAGWIFRRPLRRVMLECACSNPSACAAAKRCLHGPIPSAPAEQVPSGAVLRGD